MNRQILIIAALALAIALAGCAAPEEPAAAPATTEQPTATPAPLPVPTPTDAAPLQPAVETEPPAAAPQQTDEKTQSAVAQILGVKPEQVTVISVEPVDWPNSCLGIDTTDMMCAEVIIPGYLIVADVDGKLVEFHANEDLSVVLPAGPAEPASAGPPDAVVQWRSISEPCSEGAIDSASVYFGPCGGPLNSTVLESSRADELAYFTALFAPYQADTTAGNVLLRSEGPARALPADQRMLAQWAQLVIGEAANAAAPGSAVAMSWHREGGIAGFCDDLTVQVSGQAPAITCQVNPPQSAGLRWLSSPQVDQLFAWVDAYASFDYGQKDQATADAMELALQFTGTGATAAGDDVQRAMLDYAGVLYTFGALASDTRYVQVDTDTPIVTAPGTQFPPVGEVFGGQTAFVTGVSVDGRWWRVICPDDTVGDCWISGATAIPVASGETPAGNGDGPVGASYDPAEIFATVIREVYTVDHTFGQPPNFPEIYLVNQTNDSVGAPGSPRNGQTIAPVDQTQIVASLADLPARFQWVNSRDDVPQTTNGMVEGGGAIITVGNISPQPDGTLHVPASIYIGMLAAGGQTYVLEQQDGAWRITGKTGPVWIS